MRPLRHFAFINPKIPDFRFMDIYRLRIALAALASLHHGLTTVVFCPSRSFAETACKIAQREAPKFNLDPAVIESYRAGYSAEDRREIEEGLRSGKYRVVFSTNALEIGIDIGQLDCCILASFPDNVMSAWQRIGRTGRGWDKTAYVLFYAMNSAIDQFFASNIDAFLDKPLDEIIVGVDNDELISKHIPYLLHESDWKVGEDRREILGDHLWQCANEKARSGGPIAGQKPPYGRLPIRGVSGDQSTLTYNKKEIGTISDVHRFREAYVGAIYNHRRETYRVTAHGAGEVILEKAEPYLRTDPKFFTVVQNSEILDGVRFQGSIGVCYGKVTIYDNFAGYRLINEQSEQVIDDVATTAAIRKSVRGFWLTVENPAVLGSAGIEAGMLVLEQLVRIGSPFIIPCDRHDVATLASTSAVPTVYLYETVPGGIGIAEKMLEVWRTVVEKGMALASQCRCTEGCPRCIHPPRHRPAEAGALKKSKGLLLAEALLRATDQPPEERFDPETHGWKRM